MGHDNAQAANLAEAALTWLHTQPDQAIFALVTYSVLFLLVKKSRHI